jgi:hypothetical protein
MNDSLLAYLEARLSCITQRARGQRLAGELTNLSGLHVTALDHWRARQRIFWAGRMATSHWGFWHLRPPATGYW